MMMPGIVLFILYICWAMNQLYRIMCLIEKTQKQSPNPFLIISNKAAKTKGALLCYSFTVTASSSIRSDCYLTQQPLPYLQSCFSSNIFLSYLPFLSLYFEILHVNSLNLLIYGVTLFFFPPVNLRSIHSKCIGYEGIVFTFLFFSFFLEGLTHYVLMV